MRRLSVATGLLLLAGAASAATQSELLRSVPMRFEPASGRYQWMTRGAGYAVAFGSGETILAAGDRAVRLTFEGANKNAAFRPLEKSAAATNYFRGSGRRSAPAYGKLERTGVYPGIDVVYYGDGQHLEYDFEIARGADPSVIAMRFDGASRIRLNQSGDIVLTLGDSQITQKLPTVYQRTSLNEVTTIPASYHLDDNGTVRLSLGAYDSAKPLVIDPEILMTAYLPGTGGEGVVGLARDGQGLVYLSGYTFSTDFALVGDVYSYILRNDLREAWVTKIDPTKSGNELILYSSFFGSSATDDPKGIAVDAEGLVYLVGITDSFDFPTTPTGYVTTFPGGTRKMFMSVLDTTKGVDGLKYSTLFGGNAGTGIDEPTAIAVGGGKVYITGYTTSDDYPVGAAMFEKRLGGYDAFITVFDPDQSGAESLIYSSYFGGTGLDQARTIAVDSAGSVYIAGATYSGDFPTSLGAYRTSYSGLGDAFLTKLDISTNTLQYSTYLGGSDTDQARKIVLQPDGRVGITGYTFSYDFQITQNAFQPVYAGNADVFLTILDPSATTSGSALVYSTFFGGADGEVGYDVRTDAAGKYYFCGYTLSTDFPLRNALNPVSDQGGSDAFVAVIDPAALPSNALIYSSYITGPGTQIAYGLDVGADGSVMVTGISTGLLFPPGQAAPVIPSNTNVFLLRFQP